MSSFATYALIMSLSTCSYGLRLKGQEGEDKPHKVQLSTSGSHRTNETLSALSVERILEEANKSATIDGGCDLCHPFNWAFIFGTGRSGSTSTLNMMNAVPGVYMAGENADALGKVQSLYHSITAQPPNGIGGFYSKDGPWKHNSISDVCVRRALQNTVQSLMGEFNQQNTKMIGFKEIRTTDEGSLNFAQHLFPCAKFIIQVRKDVHAQSKSAWWAQDPHAEGKLRELNRVLEHWHNTHPGPSFLLHLEEFSVGKFNAMLEHIGVRGCKFQNVAHANKGGYGDGSGVGVSGHCKFK